MFEVFFDFRSTDNSLFRYSLRRPSQLTPTQSRSTKERKTCVFRLVFPDCWVSKHRFVASLALLTSGALYAQNSDSGDVTALKAQMEKMQKQYEDRISAMESKMQSLESKADSGSILNTHVLTDDNGKQYEGKGPALDESFLKSLTRNFSFTSYIRAGVQFNGSGGRG